ncbi:MAG: hypothetical protein IJO33_02735 [Bacilli bacterium]|nr:hypothetical protein [Bacilli bacterium]
MKKFNSIIILLISMFVFTAEIVCADSIELTGDTTFSGDSFTVGLTVNGKPGDSDMKVGGIQANDFIFNDDSNLTLKKLPSNIKECTAAGTGVFTVTAGLVIVVYAQNPADEFSNPGTVAKITCKVTDDFKVGDSVKMSFADGYISNTAQDGVATEGSSITVKRIEEVTETPETDPIQPNSEKKYICKKVDDTFYGSNGDVVSKLDYEKQCPVEPNDTGISLPFLFIMGGLAVIVAITIKNKKTIKFFRV